MRNHFLFFPTESSGAAGYMDERLWNYIDGSCTDTEKSVIEQLIRSDIAWQQKYGELSDIHHAMQASELEEPSMRFTKNVMEEIARHHIAPATKNYIDKRVIWGIAIFFLTTIAVFLIYGLSQINWSASETGIIDKYVNDVNTNLDKIDYSRFFNNTYLTVFMMLNLILGLMLLDNYLSNKKKQHTKEAR